jgi:hypothetical protein
MMLRWSLHFGVILGGIEDLSVDGDMQCHRLLLMLGSDGATCSSHRPLARRGVEIIAQRRQVEWGSWVWFE